MIDQLVDHTLSLLRAELPNSVAAVHVSGEDQRIELPFAEGAEYRFYLWFYSDGEREIGAKRIDSAGNELVPDTYFWYHPFELPDYGHSPEDLAAAFDVEVLALLHVATRVRQQRGVILSTLALDREVAPGEWGQVYQHGALFAIKVADTPTRDHVWSAPAIAAASINAPGA